MDETWRPVLQFEGSYEVSDLGRVRSWLKTGNGARTRRTTPSVMSPVTADGFWSVRLIRYTPRGVRVLKRVSLARLVLVAFVGPCPPGHEARHQNSDRMDNRLANLRWERRNTRKRRGVALRGEGHYASKLTEQAVREMRAMAAQARRGGPLTQGDIAAHFGVSQGTASMVIHRKTWKHVP